MFKRIMILAAALACAAALSAADDLETTLRKLSQDAGTAYIAPVVSAFGADLNGGWFHESPQPVWWKYDFEVGVVYMGAMFGDKSKTFSANGSFRFNREQAGQLISSVPQSDTLTAGERQELIDSLIAREFILSISGPTVVGSRSDSVKLAVFAGMFGKYPIPPQFFALPVTGLLEDMTMFSLLAPQITSGTVMGTMVTVRYYPGQTIKKIGKVNYFGLGFQHNPMFWFKPLRKFPLNISLFAATQTLKAGSLIKCRTFSAGLQASKRVGFYLLNLTPYAGLGYEQSSIDIAYQYQIDQPGLPATTQDVRFTLKGENTTRATVGLNFKILIVNINADYNFGKYDSFTAGAMVKF